MVTYYATASDGANAKVAAALDATVGMINDSAVADGAFNLIDVLQNANSVVQAVVVLLVVLSVYSWGVIIKSYVNIGAQKSKLGKFNKIISTDGAHIEKLQGRMSGSRQHSKSRGSCMSSDMMYAAIKMVKGKEPLEDKQDFKRALEYGMRVEVDRALFAQEKRLSGLANISSLAPFIGLFGTIIGIMHSFSSIFATQSVSLKVIAPSISEALFATAIGIFVAIPAGLFYNKLINDARHLRNEAEILIHNFSRNLMI